MARIKYYYDTETCKYVRVKVSKSEITYNVLGFLAVSLIMASGLTGLYNTLFPSNREIALKKDNEELLMKQEIINSKLDEMSAVLTALQDRDDNIYRVIFEVPPIPLEVRKGGTGGSEKYKDLLEEKLIREDLIISAFQKIDNLKKRMYIQTKSHDELVNLSLKKADMLSSIPAIQPVSNGDLKRFASGFGYRMHPIYKVRKMHTGCDFSAPTGTPIFATGDGVVIKVEMARGYGNQVEIDHGYGYITKYAHMSKFEVKVGQRVKRGQNIGRVGNTGTSVAPHLHYEIIHNGVKVDPLNYFFNDLSPAEYDKLLDVATIENQSLGGGPDEE